MFGFLKRKKPELAVKIEVSAEKEKTDDTLYAALVGCGIKQNISQQIAEAINNFPKEGRLSELETTISEIQAQEELKIDPQYAISLLACARNAVVAADLNSQWFMYVGSNLTTTREFCEHMTEKTYVHISEIPTILLGVVDEHQCEINATTGLPKGMIAGTNADNFIIYRGGWNCGHQLMPVSEVAVPEEVRKRFEAKLSDDDINLFVEKEIRERIALIEDPIYFSRIFIDDLFEEAAIIVIQSQSASTSLIQRKLSLGYNRTGRIMDQLEYYGIVGRAEGSKPRQVLLTDLDNLAKILELIKFPKGKEFIEHYLPSKIEYIESQVEEYFAKKEKELLKQQILKEEEIKHEKLRQKQLKKQVKAEMMEDGIIMSADEDAKREPIPQDVQDRVWNRDGGKCVKCGSKEKLEFDHIIPFSKGGSNTYRNLQILCEKCNRQKNNKIG